MNSPSVIPCSSDTSFGPAVEGFNRNFDFTVTFEESILSIVPSVLLILVAPVRILLLKDQRRRVGEGLSKLRSWCVSFVDLIWNVKLMFCDSR
jgi:hypothetical protein